MSKLNEIRELNINETRALNDAELDSVAGGCVFYPTSTGYLPKTNELRSIIDTTATQAPPTR